MSNADHTPTYNMKVVVQETDLKPDTLRAWERRYGVPKPFRTAGGHRLYSRYEIEQLKWLIARQGEGLSISHAIELWQQLESRGDDPFVERPLSVQESQPEFVLAGNNLAQMREAWLAACLNFDEQRAQHILAQAFAVFAPETVCLELLRKGLVEIGIGWYEGRVTVQQEHFASELAVRQLEALLASMPAPNRQGRIMVSCPPLEQHTFGPLLLTVLLRRRSWDVRYMGANVPLDRLESAVEVIRPQIVLVSAQTLVSAATAGQMAFQLQKMSIPLAYGGGVFNAMPQIRQQIPGFFLGENLDSAVSEVERLLSSNPDVPQVTAVAPEYITASKHYRKNLAAINANVQQNIDSAVIDANTIRHINEELSNNIVAALSLGNMHLLDVGIAWIGGLISNFISLNDEGPLTIFLQTYYHAAQQHLDQRAAPILNWFAEQ